jgi:hypothetical protein
MMRFFKVLLVLIVLFFSISFGGTYFYFKKHIFDVVLLFLDTYLYTILSLTLVIGVLVMRYLYKYMLTIDWKEKDSWEV